MKIQSRVGILGGMGPESTLHFYKLLLDRTPAQIDQDHLESVIAILPKIPDRTAAILDAGPDPTSQIVGGLQLLANAGATFAVVTCNTAHFFISKISNLPLPVLTMLDLVVEHVRVQKIQRVGLLATTGTVQTNIYQTSLQDAGVVVLTPSVQDQKKVMDIIYAENGVKAGYVNKMNRDLLLVHIQNLINSGAQKVILGCTELSLLADEVVQELTIDPLSILANQTIQTYMKGNHG